MVEIEGLKVIISAEVKAAIENMKKFQKVMNENMTVIKELEKLDIKGHAVQKRIIEIRKNSEKYETEQKKLVETTQSLNNFFNEMDNAQKYAYQSQTIMGKTTNILSDSFNKLKIVGKSGMKELSAFLTKFKLGWIALGVAAVGVLYGIIKQSPLLNMYMTEFGEILGYLGDTIGTIFAPFIEVALNALWKLGDWFDSNAPAMQAAIMPLLPLWQTLVDLFSNLAIKVIPWLIKEGAKLLIWIGNLVYMIATGDWKGAWTSIYTALKDIWDTYIKPHIPTWMSEMISEIDKWVSGSESTLTFMKNILAVAWKAIAPFVPDWMKDFINWMTIFFGTADAQEKIRMISAKIVDAMDWAALGIAAADKFLSGLWERIFPHVEYYRNLFGKKIPSPPGYPYEGEPSAWQTGTAFVPSTGLYTLHRGESVIPKGKSTPQGNTINFNPTINITGATINSAMDVRQLAAQLTSYWRDDLQRYARLGVT